MAELFDEVGRPIQRMMGWCIEQANKHNEAVTADTDILGSDIVVYHPPAALRIFVGFSAAGVFSAMVTKGGVQKKLKLNAATNLTADAGYYFDLLQHEGDTINFQYSAIATLLVLRVQEIGVL